MRTLIILLFSLVVLTSCDTRSGEKPALAPEKSVLLFPARNEVCTSGTIVSSSESKVLFKWNSSANTESYELSIKDLLNGTIIKRTTNATESEVTLSRNTPYSWYIISRSSKVSETAESDVWKFYNSGPGVTFYTPYPAEAISPLNGSNVTALNNKTSIKWTGSDIDGDIIGYDVYFGTNSTPTLFKSTTETIVTDLSVSSNVTYYWKVVTKDSKGNTSDSGVLQFKVN